MLRHYLQLPLTRDPPAYFLALGYLRFELETSNDLSQTRLSRDTSWDARSERELFTLLMGDYLGPQPENRIEEIRRFKKQFADWLDARLELKPTDQVLEIGSGCGFLSGWIAPRVRSLDCVDISASFVEYCLQELKPHPNARVSLIPYADFRVVNHSSSPSPERRFDKAFACSLFIHFHLYDCAAYLKELARYLKPGGWFAFDFNDADRLDLSSEPAFEQNLEWYRGDRNCSPRLMHWISFTALKQLAQQLGYTVRSVDPISGTSKIHLVLELNT